MPDSALAKTRPIGTPGTPRLLMRALLVFFLTSGAASLVYETIWARHLQLVFGTSQLAISTLLAAFMAGLALGALLAARWAPNVKRPLVAYAVLEAFIGGYALLFPAITETVTPLYLAFWRAADGSPLSVGLFQFVLLGMVLLPPTVAMGATLPLLSRFASAHHDAGRMVGGLYGANTLGAVLGTAVAGFVLLPQLGLQITTMTAVAVNGGLAVIALIVSACGADRLAAPTVVTMEVPADSAGTTLAPAAIWVIPVAAGIAGFSSLVYEVAWFRLLALMLGGSAYAFSIMLFAFLLGIGVGGWVAGARADRVSARYGAPALVVRLAWMQAGIAALTVGAMYAWSELPFLVMWMFTSLQDAPGMLWPAQLALAVALMLPPALLMGAMFPFLVRAAAGSRTSLPRIVGRIYGLNTVGALAGAFAGGFILLPALHLRGTVLAAAACNLLAALLLVGAALPATPLARRRFAGWVAASIALAALVPFVIPAWNPLLMTSGMYRYSSGMANPTRDGLRAHLDHRELLFYDEGLSSVIAVLRDSRDHDVIWMTNNGKTDASTRGDLPTQLTLAHLPFAFNPKASSALVIGLASGITTGSMTLHDGLERLDVVEIEPATAEASRIFEEYNYSPLDDPRVNLHFNDGRNHLLLVDDGTYDVVSSEPSNPWLTGVSSLFTKEFFELGRRKLAPGGVWVQWLHMYGMNPDDLCSLLGTFADVYPHARLFKGCPGDLILVGSDEPLTFTQESLGVAFGDQPKVLNDLKRIGLSSREQFIGLYLMDRPALLALAEGIERNTDDNMRIEYRAPLNMHSATVGENDAVIASAAMVPFEAFSDTAGLAKLAAAYEKMKDPRAKIVAARVSGVVRAAD